MTDAIALLALSQLVCLGGLAYLYVQLSRVRRDNPAPRRASDRVRHLDLDYSEYESAPAAYDEPQPVFPAATIATRMNELGVDIPALARRMRRTEDEVRALLQTQGFHR